MKAYKINIMPYDFEERNEKNEISLRKIYITFALPRHLMNPNLGGVADQRTGQMNPPQGFDPIEIGYIAQRIEQCKDPYVIVNSNELEILKKRIKVIAPYFFYDSFEMIKRVMDAEETILEEAK